MQEVDSIPETETTFICFVLFPLASCTFSLAVKGFKLNKETPVFLLFFHCNSKFYHLRYCQNGTKEDNHGVFCIQSIQKLALLEEREMLLKCKFQYMSPNVLVGFVLCIFNKILKYFNCYFFAMKVYWLKYLFNFLI